MEECKVCGRKNPIEGANFCYYCGAALTDRGGLSAVEPQERKAEEWRTEARGGYEPEGDVSAAKSEEPQFTKWKCFGLLCLTLIPVYGWLVLLGWLVYTLANPTVSKERREVAKGALFFVALLVILVIAFSAYMAQNPDYFDQLMGSYTNLYGSGQ